MKKISRFQQFVLSYCSSYGVVIANFRVSGFFYVHGVFWLFFLKSNLKHTVSSLCLKLYEKSYSEIFLRRPTLSRNFFHRAAVLRFFPEGVAGCRTGWRSVQKVNIVVGT